MDRGITLAPFGLVIEGVETDVDKLIITARSASTTAACPACGAISASVHSRYQRVLSDLPCQGRAVQIRVCAREAEPATFTIITRRTHRIRTARRPLIVIFAAVQPCRQRRINLPHLIEQPRLCRTS